MDEFCKKCGNKLEGCICVCEKYRYEQDEI